MPIFVKNPYNHDRSAESLASALHCDDPSRAKQEFADEVDINNLVALYMRTGLPDPLPPTFVELAENFDFLDAMNNIVEARQTFETLPAKVRSRFNHDPGLLMEFLSDPDNRREAEFLGLIPEPAVPQPPSEPLLEAPAHDPT